MNKIFKKRLKLSVLFFFVPALIAFALYSLNQNGFFNVNQIEFELLSQANQKNFSYPYLLKLEQDLNFYKGESLWTISLKNMSQSLKNEKWIKEFRISRSWPSKIVIEIQPHTISYLLLNPYKVSQGTFFPITESGAILSEIEATQAPPLAILNGPVFLKNDQRRKQAVELLKSLPEDGKLSHNKVSQVGFDDKEGFWVEVIKSQTKIKLGEEQFAMKAARVSQVMDYLENRDLKARVIDANLSKKVLVRLQQRP